MEIDRSETETHGPGKRQFWYKTKGVNDQGITIHNNIFADSKKEADALGQGLAIGRQTHMNEPSEYIGGRDEYESMFGED